MEGVDDYLQTCEEQGVEPDVPFKGSFNVRVSSVLHRQATEYARDHNMNLNSITKEALTEYLSTHVRGAMSRKSATGEG